MHRPRLAVTTLMLILSAPVVPALADAPKPSLGPAVVMIIRHAEKAADMSPDLSPRGFERAAALATVFPAHFPRPDFLIATKRSKNSDRPLETIAPLAKAMHLDVAHDVKDDDFAELAKSVMTDPKYAGKTVLIAWHHGRIPELAHALGARDAPDQWKEDVFDRVWKITYENGVSTWTDLPEHALPGDSEK